ncbi:SDR family oxidoreductase [Hoyosella altamirensis]|uniref:NAD(P)-dependent dehydrogenase (Short-subunit alcohol dehydrogenase family) n=1 Tax=Hoyosella altamirensis TaxID=616997 RepID=A0A839RKK3_9ACTN|nr:SDR family oxidoreductase [Hoyosella altamirensis]MBB3036990.1 NAD(P)-dependent dehydrogenase (short-subunit alcohol dehydrogenase family) [Hoyosella altamirensis]
MTAFLGHKEPREPLLGDRVIAITGGARGIGYAIARAAKHAGAMIAISDIDEGALNEAANTLDADYSAKLDVTNPDAFAKFLHATESALGPLDALVNNAGIMPTGPLLEQADDLIRRVIEINTLGVIFGTKHALELMVPRGRGHIVNMCSTMGETAIPGLAVYNASKAATVLFTDSARLEHRHTGVKFSAILPGTVSTELAAGLTNPPGVRVATVEEVASSVVKAMASTESHRRVYIPALFGMITRGSGLMPKPVQEAFLRLLGSETAILQPHNPAARAAYNDRAGQS